MVAGKLIDRTKIVDLFEQRKRYQALADANGKVDFEALGWDNTTLQAWRGGNCTSWRSTSRWRRTTRSRCRSAVTAGAVDRVQVDR
jgi:hypothetical protein